MLLLFYAFTVRSSYYIAIGYDIEKYRCDTRDALVDRINSMDLSLQRLPTITIDEDLELDCNELPMFYYKVATLHRANTFPTYSFISNKTKGFATFTLDTSTDTDDNCPGFTFSNISVIFKGTSLNTSKISIGNNVNISSDPGFQLRTKISEMPLNFLPVFQNLTFCRLSIYREVMPNFSYPETIELELEMKYAEAYMFSIDLYEDTEVLFENDTMIVDLLNKTQIIVKLPEMINYSNAFYFNIEASYVSLSVSGYLNYTNEFPHYFYINQNLYTSAYNNVTLNEGNYMTQFGTCFNIVTGELFTLTLVMSDLYWNNPTPIIGVVLSYVNLHLQDELIFANTTLYSNTFSYYGDSPIDGNLSIQCDSLSIPYRTEPVEDCFINITAATTSDSVDYKGDLYIKSSVTKSVNVDNLFFIDNPLINLGNRNLITAKTVSGKARISPYTPGSAGTITQVMCVENNSSVNLNDFEIESDYGDAFQVVFEEGCLCVNKTKSSSQTLTVTIKNEGDDWTENYENFQRKITITFSVKNYTLDLTVLSQSTQPVTLIIQSITKCNLTIKIDQKSANMIETLQIGSSTVEMNIKWTNVVSFENDIIIYKCCSLSQLFQGIKIENFKSVTLREFSQLTEIEPFAKDIKVIILSTTAKVKNITFTDYGWRYYTDDLPEDEEREIKGFNHSNLLLPISSTNAFGILFNRMINIGLETSNPFPLYISFSTNVNAYLIGSGKWERVSFQPIILVSGTLTLELPSEILPIDFDDFKFGNYLNRASARKVTIHRTSDRIQSIISINSKFILGYSCEISVLDIDTTLYLEVNKEAVIYGYATIIHSDSILIVFRDRFIMNNAITQRMWRESNSILMFNTSTLKSPSFLDEIQIYWNCDPENRNKPSMIESAINTNMFSFEFANVSEFNVSESFDSFFNQPFQIANSVIDINCEELMSKISFVDNSMSFNFANKTISFEVICAELIYSTHPITFSQSGYQTSGFPSHIGLFLNRTMNKIDDGIDQTKGKRGLDSAIIACIIIGSIGVIIFLSMMIYSFNRHKHNIYNLVDE